ncbi:MAG TPA: hypothetical protein VEF04_10310 [Blastocatellia bacterium]|nr:hypothetical protein [Blastocatellia bacterium]
MSNPKATTRTDIPAVANWRGAEVFYFWFYFSNDIGAVAGLE